MSGEFTKGPWIFKPMDGFDDLHKLRGTTPDPHEGYFRSNGGDWSVACEDGRVAMVDFKGTAKRGHGYNAPDPEGQANARLISCAPEMAEMLLDEFHREMCVCKLNPLVGAPVPCQTCQKEALLKKAGVL